MMISDIVTNNVDNKKLMYFGKYYKTGEVPSNLPTISDENYLIKINELVPIYSSQKIIVTFLQMLNHEEWVKYENWGKNNE